MVNKPQVRREHLSLLERGQSHREVGRGWHRGSSEQAGKMPQENGLNQRGGLFWKSRWRKEKVSERKDKEEEAVKTCRLYRMGLEMKEELEGNR